MPSGGSSQSPSSTQVPSESGTLSLSVIWRLRPVARRGRGGVPRSRIGTCHCCRRRWRRRLLAAATPHAWNPGGRDASRRRAPRRSRRRDRPRRSGRCAAGPAPAGDAVRKIFTSASGSTTVPMSRPSTTTATEPSASSRWRSTNRVRTSGTADTAETALVTASPRISTETSSPPRKYRSSSGSKPTARSTPDANVGHGGRIVGIEASAQHRQRHDPVHRPGVEVARTQGPRQTP